METGMTTAMQWGTACMNLCQGQEQVLASSVFFHIPRLWQSKFTGDTCALS